MVKNVYHPDDRSFNDLMSRIRTHFENAFAGQSTQFTSLSFFRKVKMGERKLPRNITRQMIVATIPMTIRATFYGNQLTHELNNEMRVSLKELLDLAT